MKVSTILDQIDMGSIALPEFQRGYVWSRRQVRSFITSLYKRHPVGSLLVWQARTEQADARGDQDLSPGTVNLLLDGQQRVTTLYGIIRGEPPEFFGGKASAFTGLHFHALFEPEEAANLKVRSQLMNRLTAFIEERSLANRRPPMRWARHSRAYPT